MVEPFKKKVIFDDDLKAVVRIDIEYTADGRLSISGSTGTGHGGQCQDEMLRLYPESRRLFEIWEAWHLNDMRAACEHQRTNPIYDPDVDLEITKYRLKYKVLQKQNELKEVALADAQMDRSEKHSFNKRERRIIAAPYSKEQPTFDVSDIDLYEFAELKEVKSGWTRPEEHPGGILTKKCEVCDYAYGSSWLFEAVPEKVLEELRAM